MAYFTMVIHKKTCEKMRDAVDFYGKRVYSKTIMKPISVNTSIRFFGFFWRFTA